MKYLEKVFENPEDICVGFQARPNQVAISFL